MCQRVMWEAQGEGHSQVLPLGMGWEALVEGLGQVQKHPHIYPTAVAPVVLVP